MTEQLSFRLGEPRPDILQGLQPEQRLAVEHGAGPLLVVAGAGTGKTHVFSGRPAGSTVSAVDDGPRSIGRARRCGPRSMSGHTLVAMR